jgi:hypothetical protein
MPVEYPPQQPFYATTCPPLSGPDIDRDVNALRKAMKGMGTGNWTLARDFLTELFTNKIPFLLLLLVLSCWVLAPR